MSMTSRSRFGIDVSIVAEAFGSGELVGGGKFLAATGRRQRVSGHTDKSIGGSPRWPWQMMTSRSTITATR